MRWPLPHCRASVDAPLQSLRFLRQILSPSTQVGIVAEKCDIITFEGNSDPVLISSFFIHRHASIVRVYAWLGVYTIALKGSLDLPDSLAKNSSFEINTCALMAVIAVRHVPVFIPSMLLISLSPFPDS